MADTIDGLDAVVGDFDRAGRTAGLRASRVVVETARDLQRTMRATVPVRTGQLRASITATTPDGGPLGTGDLEADIGPELFTGRFVELGTVKMSPRPFVFPAADAHLPDYERRLGMIAGDV